MDYIYKSIEGDNLNIKSKKAIALCDMIAHMLINKKLIPIVTELFIRD